MVNLCVMIEDVCVQSRVHALPGTACRKASTTAKEDLDRSKGVDVLIMNSRTFEREIEMVKLKRRIVSEMMTTSVIHWRAGIENRLLNVGLGLYTGVVEVGGSASHRLVK